MLDRRTELWLAVTFFVFGLLAFFVWAPFDSETPAIYEFRRQVYIGDAMLPLVAAAGMTLCAGIHLVLMFLRRPGPVDQSPFDALTVVFFAKLAAVIALSLVLLYWAGPVAVALFAQTGDETVSYRQMRASLPWKYIGFVLGGVALVGGIISLIEGRLSRRGVLAGLLAVTVLIVVFDLPFDTILLPPNGDF